MDILDKLMNEGVIPYDVANTLKSQFDQRVEARAEELCESKIAELEQKGQDYIKHLDEQFEEKLQTEKEALSDKVSAYLDVIVENYNKRNEENYKRNITSARLDALVEGFQAMLIAGGLEVKDIQREMDYEENLRESEIEEAKERYNNLIDDNIKLKEENEALKKARVCESLFAGLSSLQKEKLIAYGEKIDKSTDEESFKEMLSQYRDDLVELSSMDESVTQDVNYGMLNINPSQQSKSIQDFLFKPTLFK